MGKRFCVSHLIFLISLEFGLCITNVNVFMYYINITFFKLSYSTLAEAHHTAEYVIPKDCSLENRLSRKCPLEMNDNLYEMSLGG